MKITNPTYALFHLLVLGSISVHPISGSTSAGNTPILTTEKGASVYYAPESGGLIQVSLPSSSGSGSSSGSSSSDVASGASGTVSIIDGGDHLVSQGLVEDDDDSADYFDPAQVGAEVEIDLSQMHDLTKDSIVIDLGTQDGPMTFVRDDHAATGGVLNTNYEHENDASRSRRRKYRRIQEIRMDAVQDLLDDPNIDYLPPNSVFDDEDPSQKFQYFEGKASINAGDSNEDTTTATTTTEATVYLKQIIHPTLIDPATGQPIKILSGIIITNKYEYQFRGDPTTGKTLVSQYDPSKFPGMPPPLDPMEEENEGVTGLDEEGRRVLKTEWDMVEKEVEMEGKRKRRRKLEEDGDDNKEEAGKDEEELREEEAHVQVIDLGHGMRGTVQRRTQSDDGSVLDMMVAYTLNALCEANKQSYPCDDIDPAQHINIISRAEQSVAYTNQAYINSGIETQLRLVYVHYTPGLNDSSYSCSNILGAVTRKNDGIMEDVHDKRDEWGADFVALLTSTRVSGCGGIAWLGPHPSYTFSVTLQAYSVGGTFAHEVGHNYGCEHDRLNASPGKPYQYGWQDPEAEFRTIMAYNCPGRYCKRIQYFSNPDKRYNGKIMGNAVNDCARRHNDVRKSIAKFRNVRVTNAPTISHAPSKSPAPSSAPSSIPSTVPTSSNVPSSSPTISIPPTGMPSEYPTFNIRDLDEFDKLVSPGTTSFQVQHGIMFDIEAKDVDITIHNFRIPFLKPGNVTISVYSKDGSFWYEKNNPDAWTLLGSPLAYSPGITLESPVSLPLRGGTEYGFDPIVIAAGTKKGIYITIDDPTPGKNLIGMDKKELTTCDTQASEPFDFPVWFENNDLAVHEGVYKDYWKSSVGTAGSGSASFRFIGSIIYKSERTSSAPSTSSLPSSAPTSSLAPSGKPSESTKPSISVVPSGGPSISLSPSLSLAPSTSLEPSSLGDSEIASGIGLQFAAIDGIMFEITAKTENVVINNLKLTILSVDAEYAYDEVDLIVYVIDGSFYDETAGDAVDQAGWVEQGRTKVYASPTLTPIILPANSFTPFFVKQGNTVGIYVTISDPKRNHKILAYAGDAIKKSDFEDSHILVREGLAKQWDACLNWGDSLTNLDGSPTPHALLGSLLYSKVGTSEPTSSPSLLPSVSPSLSLTPSTSSRPSVGPTTSAFPSMLPSAQPSSTKEPSGAPTSSAAPSYARKILETRSTVEGGNDGYGIMFDIVALKPVEIHNIFLSGMQNYPMNIKIYTRSDTHYNAYDDISKWQEIKSYTNFTADADGGRLTFPPQFIGMQGTRAFYIAITETYGEIWPLLGGLLPGADYRNGIWANDTAINLMEGLKFYGISEEHPMGLGTFDSGAYMLEGPGGTSFNMKDGRIEYSLADTIMPSTEPSVSAVPTVSLVPTTGPSISMMPSSSPSLSSMPSDSPTSVPSISAVPTSTPSTSPSSAPSVSAVPSFVPSISSMPSSSPSDAPSLEPSAAPSDAPSISSEPSDTPSSTPSLAPSVSSAPSNPPSVSLMPSQSREFLTSSTSGDKAGSFGVMFEVTAKRAILVQTFAVKHFGGSGFNFHVYTRPGAIGSSYKSATGWTKLGEASFGTLSSSSNNPVTLPWQNFDPVTLNTGDTQSFYIACVGNYFRTHQESSDAVVENGDLSIAAGLSKYPYDTLFHSSTLGTAGSTKYMFQGKLIYSYAVEPPSASPSDFPSSVPSISAAPTFKTEYPSTVPTTSLKPTGSPITPTATPTISVPPTYDPFAQAKVVITIPSKLSLSGFQLPTSTVQINTVLTLIANTVKARASVALNNPGQRIKEVRITSINGVPYNAVSSSRRLQDDALIEYEIILEEICATTTCDDSQTVANALYNAVTDEMRTAIDNGSLTTAIVQSAVDAGSDASALLAASVESGDFSAVVTSLIGLLGEFYPDWDNGGYCKNDGNEPDYMKLNPTAWVYSTLDGCCTRYFPFAYNDCLGTDAVPTGLYYPDWSQSTTSKCLLDDAGTAPDYMVVNPTAWMYSTIEDCCTRYYKWDLGGCVVNSGGSITLSATRKWYAGDGKCMQDCVVDTSDPTCGGMANAWDSLFDSSSTCCEMKFRWMNQDKCDADSQGVPVASSSAKWYVKWTTESCVQDCETGGGECGGFAEPWDRLHDSKATCCSLMQPWNTNCFP